MAGIAVGALLVASCSSPTGSEKVELPEPAPSSTSALPASPSGSPEDGVRAAYLKYWEVLAESWTVPDDKLESFLAKYVADPYLTTQVRSAMKLRKYKTASAGAYTPNVVDIKITKGEEPNSIAYITDCQDASAVHLLNTKTQKALPGSNGQKRNGIRMTFVKTPDGWLAFRYEANKQACA